jgi:hypothetical protein
MNVYQGPGRSCSLHESKEQCGRKMIELLLNRQRRGNQPNVGGKV